MPKKCSAGIDPRNSYFPEVEEVAFHAMAFAGLMLAHAAFEVEIRNLQGIITGDQNFGDQLGNQWPTNMRAKCMSDLIKDKLGDVAETGMIVKLLKKAKKPTDARNLLAHGHWWRFNPDRMVLTVRRGRIHKGECMNVDWTVADIDHVTEAFKQLEIELYKMRREFEHNWMNAIFPLAPD